MTMNRVLLYALAVLGWFSFAFAQYGKVSGRVIDANTGEPLVAAAVYLDEIGMGTYTDENGYFVILRVPPGTYTLKAEYVGYVPYVLKNLVVEADRTKEVIIKMKPAEAAVKLKEEVVVAKEPVIKKDLTASVDKIRTDKLQSLPVVDVQQAIQLQAGVKQVGGVLQIRGGRIGEVAYVVDGADMRDPYSGARTPELPLNAVAEISVNKGGFGAEYGDAASGVIEVVTKEGTDRFEFQGRVRSRNFSILNNIYLGDMPIGASIAEFLDADKADYYAKWLEPRYLGNLYNDIYAFEKAKYESYVAKDFNSGDPLLADMKELYSFYDGYPTADQFYNRKNNLGRIELAASGPIIKKKLRFSGSIDYFRSYGNFHRSDPNDNSAEVSAGNKTFNWQFKLTYLPTSSIKFFVNTVGTRAFTTTWSPGYRLAVTHNTYYKSSRFGLIGGVNYLISPKTYVELRVAQYNTSLLMNIFEDIDLDGVDDFADRDWDGYVEIDKDALNYVLTLNGNTYQYNCGPLLDRLAVDPNYVQEDHGEYVELRSFWWESNVLSCYPNFDRPISLITGVTPEGDTMTLISGQFPEGVTFEDTIFKFNSLPYPDPMTYDRGIWHWDRRNRFQAKLDYVAQDFMNLKNHEVKMGLQFENIRLMQDDQDFPSGSNTYPDPVDANPRKFAAYVRDKMEFEGMVANVGIRLDYFDPNAYMPSDLNMPVKHYEDGYVGFMSVDSLDGAWTWDNGLGIRRDTLNLRNPVKVDPVYYLSPRIGISHPISERDVLHFTYGHYFQIPRLFSLYMNNWWLFPGAYPVAPNPGLRPEKTISYELGVRHAFTPYMFIDVVGFYKDIYDLIQSKVYYLYDVDQFGNVYRTGKWYSLSVNADYASVRGFEVQFAKQPGGDFLPNLSFDINYTFQVARGSNSGTFTTYILTYYGIPPEYTKEYYLSWDQRHSVMMNVAWTVPYRSEDILKSGWGVSLVYTYGTGYPYSPPLRNPRDVLERTNSLRYPGLQNADLNLYKLFKVAGVNLKLFMNIYNLFNDNEIYRYSNIDQYFQCLEQPALCNGIPAEGINGDITIYNPRRRTEIGIEFNWRQ